MASRFDYECCTGIFAQDEPSTDADTFDFTEHFGLLASTKNGAPSPSSIPSWKHLIDRIESLNHNAPTGTRYCLLILGRHGQGEHNVAETKYGTELWDAHYSKLDSADGLNFLDAHLTDLGRQQALTAHATWKTALEAGLPPPQSYYVSPLDRCLETCKLTFSGLGLPNFVPKVRELLREVIGEHTCDKRSSRGYIATHYPDFAIEEGLAEEDPLWRADHRETNEEQEVRLRAFLDGVFAVDEASFVSMTAHSGAIRNILKVVGHREFALQTGAVIPCLVKITEVR